MTWMNDELMIDWLMDGCFLLFYLLTYLYIGKIPENFTHSILPEKLQPYVGQPYHHDLQIIVEHELQLRMLNLTFV